MTNESNRDVLLTDWKKASEELAKWKAREAGLRSQMVEAFSQDQKPGHSGTENVDIGWGYTLKIVHKISYNLDKSDNNAKIDVALDAIEKSMEGGNVISERLVSWKPELSVSEYKKLDNEQKAIIDKVLTIKDASPTIELVKPKA